MRLIAICSDIWSRVSLLAILYSNSALAIGPLPVRIDVRLMWHLENDLTSIKKRPLQQFGNGSQSRHSWESAAFLQIVNGGPGNSKLCSELRLGDLVLPPILA